MQGNKTVTGFTLIEMVMVIVLLGILAGLTAPIFSQGLMASRLTVDNLQSMEKIRYASERMAREIRQVSHNGASYDVTTMTAANFVFVKAAAAVTTVSINYSGSVVNLGYSVPLAVATLVDEVSAMSFAYFNAMGAVTSNAVDLAFVEINLTLQNPNTGGVFTQRTRVALRNQS
ncbi:MAG: prepilin-type N-terminal cleavage/methylation domain-containing protein [Gammaproteobacteria bacterium]|nr:prepilin-type N-terminal cleavage/methylation domain-containing protein [Gammaproteobacteria bacterium]